MRLCVVGTGTIVQENLPVLVQSGCCLASVCSTPRSQETAAALCRQYQIPQAYTDFAAALAEADAVYIAVPNHLHYDFARQALEAGRHVIVEKPMTSSYREAAALASMAKERGLFLFEAISTIHLPGTQTLKELLPRIGEVKIVTANYSQYSRRYDAFRAGQILPAFDPAKSGGALMDLNVYNVHLLLDLFGSPDSGVYHANLQRGIDTSGILTLDYGAFQAVSIAAKDCAAPCGCTIQGTKGYLRQEGPANTGGALLLHTNDGAEERFPQTPGHRMAPLFRTIRDELAGGDTGRCYAWLDHSLRVMELMTRVRLAAGIRFPADG